MPIDSDVLADELLRLRRGRAMLRPDLSRQLGAQTRQAIGAAEGDTAPVLRRKATAWIKRLLRKEPDLRTAALMALALRPGADQKRLSDREEFLAIEGTCAVRTVRRRVSQAMEHLVAGSVEADDRGGQPDPPRDDGFVVRTLWATMRLDTAQPELHERRLIVATTDQLTEIVGRLSVPRSTPDVTENDMGVQAKSGGKITSIDRCSPEAFRFTLRLDRLLMFGDTHTYNLVFTIPKGQVMRPHYVFLPLVPCERFELTVRFGRPRPVDIWLVDGVPPRVLDHRPQRFPRLSANAKGAIKHTFLDLRQGMAYGVSWTP